MASKLTLSVIAASILGACVPSAAALDITIKKLRPQVLLSPQAKAASRFARLDQTFQALRNSGAAAVDAAMWRETIAAHNSIKIDLNSLSEMGEMESLRLQMAMDRLSKLMSMLSNMLKKQGETSRSIIQQMK